MSASSLGGAYFARHSNAVSECSVKPCAVASDVCEDGELKQRMLDMKEEIDNSRVIKSRELSRKRSANIRRSDSSLISLQSSAAAQFGKNSTDF